jgi:glycosyltransferase involved in cell wall biosynthesis
MEGDVAWLWPALSIATYHEVYRRGIPIVMEGINTRIAFARRILEEVHEAEGLPPPFDLSHGLPEAEEEEMLSMATYFFAPSPKVEEAVRAEDSSFRGTVIPTSYGAWVSQGRRVDRTGREGVTVAFIASVTIRKNAHGVLRAWAKIAPRNARLLLVGPIHPYIAQLCEQELNLPSVETLGYVKDLSKIYTEADIFILPSFEEGSPQVTYQAATFGLPIIASPMGDGGVSRPNAAVYNVDPYNVDSIAAALAKFIEDPQLRQEYSRRSYEAAPFFDWSVVGQNRYNELTSIS